MNNKIIVLLLLLILLSACNKLGQTKKENLSEKKVNVVKPTFNIIAQGSNIFIISSDTLSHCVKLTCLNEQMEYTFSKSSELDIRKILKVNSKNRISIAYDLLVNDYIIPISVSVDEELKKNIGCRYELDENVGVYAELISGSASPLIRNGNEKIEKSEVKKWLYYNDIHIEEVKVEELLKIANSLNNQHNGTSVYSSNQSIPIIKSFAGINYKISTNMHADYYYLFATDNTIDVDNFVADMVANDFIGAELTSDVHFSCFRTKNKSGLLTLLLVGINKDWTKQVMPVGLACIDNVAPIIMEGQLPDINDIIKSNNIVKSERLMNNLDFSSYGFNVNIPIGKYPRYRETLYVRNGDFYGNIANFIFEHWGEVESVIIKYNEVERKVNLLGKPQPYTYNCYLPLNIGDNYVTIMAQDKFENMSKHIHHIKMIRVEDDSPEIYINNDINIYN